MGPVPTRLERMAAVIAVLAVLSVLPAAALGSGIAAVVLLSVALVCTTVAKARLGADALLTFGVRRVPEDDPVAARYRERRARKDERLRETVSFDYDPRFDRLLAVGLAVVGIGALGFVGRFGEGGRNTMRLLIVALIALNGALIAYAASYVNADTDDD